MIAFSIEQDYINRIPTEFLEKKISEIFQFLKLDPQPDLSVYIGSDMQLKKLNSQYRGINQPTDVLSFESIGFNPETGNNHLGDIAISFEKVEKQSKDAGHPAENEIVLLLVHSILHLIGFDHQNNSEKESMWKKQLEILDFVDVKIQRISGDEDFHD
jgi:probable rRNA maturation factor